MLFLLGAFVAGLLTVVAPCVLPLLPIIIGGSVRGDARNKLRPLVIAAALAVSLIVFTLLLKLTTLAINLPPQAINYFSGGLIVLLGIFMLLPFQYAQLMARIGIERRAQEVLGSGYRSRRNLIGPIITGAALGPVFSSCSPVYGYILATVLPANFAQAFAYIIAYVVGLSLVLLAIGYYGQRFVGRIRFASNPKGWFQRGLAILFILVGLLVLTGSALKVQTYVSEHTPFDFDGLSAQLIPKKGQKKLDNSSLYNVAAYNEPEFTGLQDWINSPPLTLAGLKAQHKVVLVDFWTYSCINCIRSDVYTKAWYNLYHTSGLVVVGIHAPEFAFEQVPANVQKAVTADGITYPVALDNNLATWNAFNNQYWPAQYLIDANGQVRRQQFGEGDYHDTEEAIRGLLQAAGDKVPTQTYTTGKEVVPSSPVETPETYFGTDRADTYTGTTTLGSGSSNTATYKPATSLDVNDWTLGGSWQVEGSDIVARGNSTLTIRVAAKNVYLVGGSTAPVNIGVTIDGQPASSANAAGSDVQNGVLPVNGDRLYNLVDYQQFTSNGLVQISVPDGVQLNTFTFGS
jgi:cytochrome c biogenesis protein CcdA/thiol-disulfide isomerase/thioredoxin